MFALCLNCKFVNNIKSVKYHSNVYQCYVLFCFEIYNLFRPLFNRPLTSVVYFTIIFFYSIFVFLFDAITPKRRTKDTKGTVKLINLKQTDNAMAKNEKRQTEKQ